jgi:nucleoside diphosphate kinase
MKNTLAYVLITPYSLTKSRTGGIISRLLSLSGLRLVGARMYAPSNKMVDEYIETIAEQPIPEQTKQALLRYCDEQLRSSNPLGITNRAMLLLFQGADATDILRERVVGPLTSSARGDTVRGTYGDFVVTPEGEVRYFEPAVLISTDPKMTRKQLALFSKYALKDGGILERVIRIPKSENPFTTLVILKPDNFQRQTSTPGNVIDSFSRTGLFIVAAKLLHLSVQQAMDLYRPLRKEFVEKLRPIVQEKARRTLEESLGYSVDDAAAGSIGNALKVLNADNEFSRIVEYMTGLNPQSVPASDHGKPGTETCVALLYRGSDAISRIRKTLGATNPEKAEGGTIRYMYGFDLMKNTAHASDSPRNAIRERKIVDLWPPERTCEVKQIIDEYLADGG